MKHRALLNRGVEPNTILTNPHIRDWLYTVEQLLIDNVRKAVVSSDPSIVFSLCGRVTVDRLLRDYALLAKRLIELSDAAQETDSRIERKNADRILAGESLTPFYLVSFDRKRRRATLSIDDAAINLAFMRRLAALNEVGQRHLQTWLKNPDLLESSW